MKIPKEYILQCEKAIEIQEAWKPMIGDYILRRYTVFGEKIDKQVWDEEKMREINILVARSGIDHYIHATNEMGETRIFDTTKDMHKETCIFIPRQDQLQKLIVKLYPGFYPANILDSVHRFWQRKFFRHLYYDTPETDCLGEATMEQIFIMYIMYEKFSKVWNGEKQEWVKTDTKNPKHREGAWLDESIQKPEQGK